MILHNILNTNYNLSAIENNIKLNDVTKGRDQKVLNELRRTGFGRSNFNQ
jgi:hypothetical protein